MSDTGPIQTAAEQERSAIVLRAEAALMEAVWAALREAEEAASAGLRAAGVVDVPPLGGFLTASVHQKLFCVLCGADPKTFRGGKAETAIAVIRNSQQIAKHYWGADIEAYPRADQS